jgi:hypothetical protein
MKSLVVVALCAFVLSGCASARLRNMQEADNNALTAVMQCDTQQWPTNSARAKCESAALIAAYQQASYPYMDLAEFLGNQNVLVAKQFDAGQITAAQATSTMAAVVQRVHDQETARGGLANAQRAAFANALIAAGQAYQRAYTPPPSINCTSNAVGNYTYSNCH